MAMIDETAIIIEFEDYIRNHVATASEAFNGFAMCPYAADATIKYVVTDDYSLSNLSEYINQWLEGEYSDVLIIIHTWEDLPTDGLSEYANALEEEFGYEIEVFVGYPDCAHEVRGVLTRDDPYINLQINRKADLEQGREELREQGYYD